MSEGGCMPNIIIQEFGLDVDRHIVRSVNDLIGQVKLVTDNDTAKRAIYQYGGWVGQADTSVYPGSSPYFLFKIEDIQSIKTGGGLIIEKLVELSIALIFLSSPTDRQGNDSGIQMWGDALRTRTEQWLQDATLDNAHGIAFDHPYWQFSEDRNFKSKLDRSISPLAKPDEKLQGSLFRIYLQQKLRVFPNTPLN